MRFTCSIQTLSTAVAMALGLFLKAQREVNRMAWWESEKSEQEQRWQGLCSVGSAIVRSSTHSRNFIWREAYADVSFVLYVETGLCSVAIAGLELP